MSALGQNIHYANVRNGWKADIGLAYDGLMSLKDFIARLLANRMPASEALMRHVEGRGSGYEIDDLMSWSPSEEQEEKAIGPLLEISERYASSDFPIGISNPASFGEIQALAEGLRAQGL